MTNGWKGALRGVLAVGAVVTMAAVAAVIPSGLRSMAVGATVARPVILGLADLPSRTSAVVSWSTNNATVGRVDLGATTSYGRAAASPVARVAHSVTLTGLVCGTVYHYRITATNAAGSKVSNDDVVLTASCTKNEVPYRHVVIDDAPPCHVLERGLADINGDGRTDAIVGWGTACSGGGLFWYEQPSAGDLTAKWRKRAIVPSGTAYEDLIPFDVNADGAVDVIAAVDNVIHWYENPRGRGLSAASASWVDHVVGDVVFGVGGMEPPEAHDFSIADIDGDGRADVITNAFVFFNDGRDSWSKVTYNRTGQGAGVFDAGSTLGAVNLLGIGNEAPHDLVWLENPREHGGNARTDMWIAHRFAPGYDAKATGVAFATGDLNGDGRADIVTAQAERDPSGVAPLGGLVWWEAPIDRVGGTWAQHVVDATMRDVHKVEVVDMNGSGTLDVVAAEQDQSRTRRVIVFRNDGRGRFVSQVLGRNAGHNQAIGDVNGDGRPDVLNSAHGFFGGPVRIELWCSQ
ncbi:MAG: FG-GAP-like repeat-containing protein [Acidimicrobiia bacterium]